MLESLTSPFRELKFQVWWARNRSEVLEKRMLPPEGKYAGDSFGTVVGSDWYQREGYYKLSNALGGGRGSHTGKCITEDVAFEVSAWYAGIKVISEDLGSLPFFVYERFDGGEGSRFATKHPLFPVLHDLANPELSAGEWVQMMTAHAILGNAFSLIDRNPSGKIIYLWPLMPSEVKIERNATGQLYYVHYPRNQPSKRYARDEIFHLRGFTLDGQQGDDLLGRARHALGLAAVGQEYASKYFANSASPDIVVQFPAGVLSGKDSVQTFKDAWRKWHQGPSRWHEPAVVQGGEVKVIEKDHQKSQLIEQRTFQILEVCRYIRLQPYKLAEYGRATWNNIEAQQIDYLTHSIGPWQIRWKQAVHRCLLTRDEQLEGKIFAEHLMESLQRGDFTAQSTGFARLLEKGVYSINDVRKWLKLNPIEGGDEHFIQLNMVPVQQAAELAQANIDAVSSGGQPEEQQNSGNVTPIRRASSGT